MRVLGKRMADYVSKKDGQRKQGVSLYFADDSRSDVIGEACGEEYIANTNECYPEAMKLQVGEEFDFRLGYPNGRIIGIIPR